jgi:hypothetical protein
MPWTYQEPPAVALNWTDEERRRCVDAANAVIEETGDDEQAIFACIAAAGKEIASPRSSGARNDSAGVARNDREGKMKSKKRFDGKLEWKADADVTGQFSAVFATLGVVDHDGDVTKAGAFEEGQEAIIEAWNHNYGAPPVGKGVIRTEGDKALVEGRFFLDTPAGQEHYRVVKALGDLQEWSYTYSILEHEFAEIDDRTVRVLKKLDVWGIAPVQRGAGIDTFTVDVKGQEGIASPAGTRARNDSGDGEGEGDGQAGDSTPSTPKPSTVRLLMEAELVEL